MPSKTEQIRQDIYKTSAALEANLHEFGSIVEGKYEQAKDSVADVKNAVSETLAHLNPEYQVQKRPWTCVGVAVGGGFLLGNMAVGKGGDASPRPSAALPRAPRAPLGGAIAREFGPEIEYVKSVVLSSAIGYLAKFLKDKKPEFQPHISELETRLKSRFCDASAVGGTV